MAMEEIVDDEDLKPLNDNRDQSMVEIFVRIVGPARPTRLLLPSPIPVHNLRKRIATENQLPIEKLRLILRGNVLHDSRNGDHVDLYLKNGDSLMAVVKPNPASKSSGDGLEEDDDEDEDLKFQLPESSSRWKRKIYSFLHDKLKLPDLVLMAIFALSLKSWIIIVMWFIFAPVASGFGIGPLYIIGTGFVLILMNLGKRKPGEVSAYSIFNENFQELPGTLNADRLDRDIRAGHL